MSWFKKKMGSVLGTIVFPGVGTLMGAAMDSQKNAMKKQADIAERTAAQEADYYRRQQEQAEADEAKATAASAATANAMKRGVSDFLFNNNLLGVPAGKKKKLG